MTRKVVVPSGRPTATFHHYSIPAWDELGGPCRESGSDIGSAKLQISSPGILVSKLNPRIPRVISVHPQQDQNCCASTEFIYYTPCDPTVNLRFYYHYFASKLFQKRLEAISIGSTNSQTRAKSSETLSWQIPHPHPNEQRRIAEILDASDEAIAKTEMEIEKLKMVQTGMMHDLLTRGLDKDARLRPSASESSEIYRDTKIGLLPKEWSADPLTNNFETYSGGTPARGVSQYYGGRIPWVKSGEVNLDTIVSTEESLSEKGLTASNAKWIPEGTPLIAMYGATAGKVSWLAIRATANQAVLAIVPRSKTNHARYALWAMRFAAPRLISMATGSGQPNLSKGIIDKSLLPLPADAKEQAAIAEILDAIASQINTEQMNLDKLTSLKSGLTDDLLAGKVFGGTSS